MFSSDGPCPACGAFSDSHGNHAISCAMAGERIARHNHLRDAIFQMAQSANLAPLKEGRALLPGTEERPADVLIPKWSGGKDTAYDVTVVNPLRLDLAKKSAEEPGFAVAQAYRSKWSKYGPCPSCESQGLEFIPLPVDTFGCWHATAINHLKKLGSALARATCSEESVVTQHLFQCLSILLVKDNASLLLNRIPRHVNPPINGIL